MYVCGGGVGEVGKVVDYEIVSRNWRTRKTTLRINVIFILYCTNNGEIKIWLYYHGEIFLTTNFVLSYQHSNIFC